MNYLKLEGILKGICPEDLQEEWDNSGLQIGFGDYDVKRVLVTLEVTEDVVNEAIEKSVDLIVTHHPLFFGSFNKITPDLLPTKYAIRLISAGIGVYSCHTNFDKMSGGNNDYIGNLLGITGVQGNDFLRYGELEREMTIGEFSRVISEKLDVDPGSLRFIGTLDGSRKIRKIAWCTGAGADFIMDAFDLKADVYVTGDIKYHEARTIEEFGLCCIDIGHFGSEKIFTENMANILNRYFEKNCPVDDTLEVISSEMDKDPFVINLE